MQTLLGAVKGAAVKFRGWAAADPANSAVWGLALAASVAVCFLVCRFTLQSDMNWDTAIDIQVARSLGTSFSYEGVFQPAAVYDPFVSTNGPIQYIGGAAYAVTHNIDAALVAGALSSTLVLLVGLMLIRPWLSFVPLALIFIWPTYYMLSTQFLGELWAAGCCLVAVALLEGCRPTSSVRAALLDRRALLAACFLGLAIASKLIIALGIPFLIFGAVYRTLRTATPPPGLAAFSAILTATVLTTISVLVFFLQVAFAVLHTVRAPWALLVIPRTFMDYVLGHLNEAGPHRLGFASLGHIIAGSDPAVLALVLATAVALALARPEYAPFAVVELGTWVNYGLDPAQWERRLMPMFLIGLALGSRELVLLSARYWPRARSVAVHAAAVAVVLALVAATSPTRNVPSAEADPLRRYAVLLIQEGTDHSHANEYHYGAGLVAALRKVRYILTRSAWFAEFPEISDFWNLQFYDRMASTNAQLWDQRGVALLFDRYNYTWPVATETGNCGRVIYVDGPLLLCRPRSDEPLDYQPSISSLALAHAAIVDLSAARWRLGPGMRLLHGRDGNAYAYMGSGKESGDERATLNLSVTPGATYVFSVRVDPTGISVGQFDLYVDTPDAQSTYSIVYGGVGPLTRYSTPPWTCPPHVREVQLAMQVNGTLLPRRRALTFVAPELLVLRAEGSGQHVR